MNVQYQISLRPPSVRAISSILPQSSLCSNSYECANTVKSFASTPGKYIPVSGSAEMTVAFQDGTWQLMGFRVYNIY